MERNLILAGVGGQGILTIAQAISMAAVRRGWSVKQAEVHGMSQRGGAVYSHLRYADHPLFSELIPLGECDLILAMEPLEALRYVHYLRDGAALVANTNAVVNIGNYPPIEETLDRITALPDHALVDASKLARAAGAVLAGNSVLLGAASIHLDFEPAELEGVLTELFDRKGERVVRANVDAFRLGRAAAAAYRDALRFGGVPRAVRNWMAALPPEQLTTAGLPEPMRSFSALDEAVLSAYEAHACAQILDHVVAEGRQQLFEHEVYNMVEIVGAIAPPRHEFVAKGDAVTAELLARFPGDKIVIKLVSRDVVHKSDVGAVLFVPRELDRVSAEIAQLVDRHESRGAVVDGVLLVEFVERSDSGLGQELFIGFRATREFGPVIAAGLGGVDTEYLAHKLRPGIAVAKALASETSAEEFLDLFRGTAAYDLLAGRARGHRRVVSDGELLRCFRAFLRLARHFGVDRADGGSNLCELEVNPFAFVRQRMVPLDGRGCLGDVARAGPPRPRKGIEALIEPRSIAVVGASSRRVNFGRIILNNTIDSGFPRDHLYVIKPGEDSVDGIRCVPGVREAPEPIDMLVVATGSESIPALMQEVIDSGRVASVVLIPGGLGETEGSEPLQRQLREMLTSSRARADGGPVVLGANCMGIRSRPGRYDTFFIPREKLDPRRREPVTRTALITQSGAFAITRIGNLESINPALTVTVGNQLDLTAADILRTVADRDDIDVIGVYVEGFNDLDGFAFVQAVEDAASTGKVIIFYKAGRTPAGRTATAGHTASIAGDYDVCQTAVAEAGAIVVDTFKEFEQLLEMATHFHAKHVGGRRVGVISNAGFETVGMADAVQGARYELELPPLSASTEERVGKTLAKYGLSALVAPHNPLDLNPMAGEDAYEECIRAMMDDPGIDSVAVSVVPFTPQLLTTPEEIARPGSLVERLPVIAGQTGKPMVVVMDAGKPYDVLAGALRRKGVPVLPSCDQAIRSLGRYLCHRIRRPRERAIDLAANRRTVGQLAEALHDASI